MNLRNTATVLSGNASYLVVTTDGVYAFDDVQVSAEDLSATTYTYDAANQLTAMNVNGTTTNFSYDDWGRMVGKTQGAYAATYAYRFGDKLKAVTSSFPGETASVGYNYDGLGRRRLEQRDNTTATWFRWSGGEECGEYAGTVGSWTIGALQTGYVPGLATFAGSNPSTAAWRYHLTDHLGSVRQLSGQNKAALARYDYAPYGELMRNAGLPLTVGYTGHLWDSAIGQYYAPFRYYNPQTARWNMRDPLGFVDGPNVYAYVAGNPVNYSDSTGGFWETVWDIGNLGYDVCKGDWGTALFDGIAILIPFFPAGLNKVDDIARVVKKNGTFFNYNSKKKAYEAAKRAGYGKPILHAHPQTGLPHYHPRNKRGKKMEWPDRKAGHYTFPKSKMRGKPGLPAWVPTFGGACNYGTE